MKYLLKIEKLNKRFDGVNALEDFSCMIQEKEILGLIGPNGAGKTTLFNIITRFIEPESGIIMYKGRDIIGKSPDQIASTGISRTFQNLRLIKNNTVLENIMLSFMNQPGEYLKNIFFNRIKSKETEKRNFERAFELLNYVGIANKADEVVDNLSYGQQKLLSILSCIATDADLFLLDEPVAGIDPDMIEKIISVILDLPQKGKTVFLIEHNINVVMEICNRIIFMDVGKKICEGTPQQMYNDPKVIEAYIG